MFALEIAFQDGGQSTETVLVRRPEALIGSSDRSHIVIEDLATLGYDLMLVRDVGRSFSMKAIPIRDGVELPDFLDGVYHDEYSFKVGGLTLNVMVLDTDLACRASEPPDQESIRVLQASCKHGEFQFPAIVVAKEDPVIVSFSPELPVYVGRDNQCAIRLDDPTVSDQHARIGFANGNFWVEDLGSAEGLFVDGQQVSGKVEVAPGKAIAIGRQITLVGAVNKDQLVQTGTNAGATSVPEEARTYPILLSSSEIARPARVVMQVDVPITLGRDPRSEMWLGAPHISRKHCEVVLKADGYVVVTDCSTNGTAYDGGILKKGQLLELHNEPNVLNFGGDITVGICFEGWQEESFLSNHGAPDTFSEQKSNSGGNSGGGTVTSMSRESTTEVPVRERTKTYSGTLEAMGVDWSQGTMAAPGGGAAVLGAPAPAIRSAEDVASMLSRFVTTFSEFPLPTKILLVGALCILGGLCVALLQLVWSIFH